MNSTSNSALIPSPLRNAKSADQYARETSTSRHLSFRPNRFRWSTTKSFRCEQWRAMNESIRKLVVLGDHHVPENMWKRVVTTQMFNSLFEELNSMERNGYFDKITLNEDGDLDLNFDSGKADSGSYVLSACVAAMSLDSSKVGTSC
jgi:hypothetical protein